MRGQGTPQRYTPERILLPGQLPRPGRVYRNQPPVHEEQTALEQLRTRLLAEQVFSDDIWRLFAQAEAESVAKDAEIEQLKLAERHQRMAREAALEEARSYVDEIFDLQTDLDATEAERANLEVRVASLRDGIRGLQVHAQEREAYIMDIEKNLKPVDKRIAALVNQEK